MDEELNLDHFDLGTFVDYVYALKQERDALRAQLPSQGSEAVEAECRRLQRLVNMLVRQHMPLEPVDGLDGWSEVISARKAIELRDAALTECERLRASLNDAAKAMHWVQANTPMSKRISASLAKARLAAELSAMSAKP